mgnify:FL=1
MSRFKTTRQRHMAVSDLHPDNTPPMLTECHTLFEAASSLRVFWRLNQ